MSRTVALNLLQSIKVASPCTADWDAMTGDDRVRHCGECNLNVFNLSAMPAEEAAAFIQNAEGRVCIRLFKRADGTVITQDCPVGLRRVRLKAARAAGRIGAAAALLITGGLAAATGSREPRLPRLASMRPFSTIREWLSPTPPVVPSVTVGRMMGEMVISPTRATLPPTPKGPGS